MTTITLRALLAAILAMLLAGSALAEAGLGYKAFSKSGAYDDVRADLEDAIVNRGYVIDFVGQFNQMLERTSQVAESVTALGAKSPYKKAEYLQFCAAKLAHEAVSANPGNIANCPYVLFVYELANNPGKIHVGYRLPPSGPSRATKAINAKIEKLLNDIAMEALN